MIPAHMNEAQQSAPTPKPEGPKFFAHYESLFLAVPILPYFYWQWRW